MKRAVFLILILCASLPVFSQTRVKRGVIDLSHVSNPKAVVSLDGEWEFYWKQFYNASDFADTAVVQSAKYIHCPNNWNGFNNDGEILKGDGYATYRMTIKTDGKHEKYALKLLTLSTAYKIFANGELIAQSGVISTSEEGAKPEYISQTAMFNTQKADIELIMQISNYHHRRGGPWHTIKFGTADAIYNYRVKMQLIDAFLLGSILIMAMYHFLLYFTRRKDSSTFWFAVICLCVSIRMSVMGEYTIQLIMPLQWNALVFIEYITAYLFSIAMVFFLKSLLPGYFKTKVANFMIATLMCFIIIETLTPVKFYSKMMPFFYISVATFSIYGLYAFIKASKHGVDGAKILASGYIIVFVTVINDILHNSNIIHTTNLSSLGLFLFIFSQAFLITVRISRSLARAERLSGELNIVNKNLEAIVKERTAEKEAQKEEIRRQAEGLLQYNTKITAQKEEIEDVNMHMTENVFYGKRIQRAMFPTEDILEEYNISHFIFFKPVDIVSGDFYWINEVFDPTLNRKVVIMAAADCTGHSVPGAFMSILCITFMNETILLDKITAPDQILNRLRNKIREVLQDHHSNESYKDGMDIALVKIDKQTHTLEFAGANNHLYLVKKNDNNASQNATSDDETYISEQHDIYTMHVTYADKMPIGFYPIDKDFSNNILQYEPDDTFYIFSDGYVDQFGGDKGKKFLIKNFKELLLRAAALEMPQQRELLDRTNVEWIGSRYRQIDDMIVMGFKINS